MGYRIERLAPRWVDRMVEIEESSFSRPWRREHFLHELENPFSHPIGILSGDLLVGFLILSVVHDEGEVLDLAVAPPFRGRGYGRALMEEGIGLCRNMGVRALHLEVRETAVEARSLYRHLGFSETGRRRGYYEQGIDAVLMTLSLA
ncbi:MAG: ribosomal protein S18-alanine N-acetyltransferase [Desulfuromonadia bacterium]